MEIFAELIGSKIEFEKVQIEPSNVQKKTDLISKVNEVGLLILKLEVNRCQEMFQKGLDRIKERLNKNFSDNLNEIKEESKKRDIEIKIRDGVLRNNKNKFPPYAL